MNNLRLILLLLGVAIIVGLYIRERLRGRKRDSGDDFDTGGDRYLDGMRLSTRTDADEDYTPFLSALGKKRDAPAESWNDAVPLGKAGTEAANAGRDAAQRESQIIVLHVVAEHGQAYTGPALLASLDDLGLVFGEMQIFHHYGVGDLKSDRPLFHLANMLEPGYFEPDNMDDFSSRGVSLFMQLPAPLGGEVVFELMLNTARQLAGMLGGEVLSQNREPLTGEHIESLRARARNAG